MGGLPVRRIASIGLCAALLAGVTGSAAAADPARERVRAASHVPVPGADALLTQINGLGDVGTVLAPVTALLTAVLKADNGQFSPHEATLLVGAAKSAVADAGRRAPGTAATTPTAPGGLPADALAALDKALDTLRTATTSGDVAQVAPAVNAVLTGLVDYLAAVLLGSGLPKADLSGVQTLPLPVSTSTPPAS